MVRNLTFLALSVVSALAFAQPDENMQCQKIIVAGDSQWPPYTIVNTAEGGAHGDTKLRGVGIDLARRIFGELDVPIKEMTYDNQVMMMQGIRDGEIDVVVSTYEHSGLLEDMQLLRPAYMIDPVTVAVTSKTSPEIGAWENLSGLPGIKDATFFPDEEVSQFIDRYLQVANQTYLLAALRAVKEGINKFIVGSDLQLTYAIKHNNLSPDLVIKKDLTKGGDVYMAFAKNSACSQYAVYAQKRLQDYKNNGTVDKILKKYTH